MKTPLFLFLALLLPAGFPAHAATRIWSGGGADNNWTTAANWDAAVVAGDDLVFPGTAPVDSLTSSNNFPGGTVFNTITFTGTNYTLNGNAIVLNAGLTNNPAIGGNNLFYCPITLASNQTFSSIGSGASVVALNGNITNNGNTLTFAGLTFTVTGVISGSGGLQSSAGQLVLGGTNTFSGATVVTSGFLIVNNSQALGATSAGTTVNANGVLSLQNSFSVPEPVTLSGKILNLSGTNTLTGELALVAASCTVDVRVNTLLNFSNAVSGAGGLLKTNTGILRLAGNTNNTYLGPTVLNAGTLLLSKSPGTNAIPGSLVIGDGTGGVNADVVRLQAGHQISDAAAVTINSSGLLDANGFTEIVGPLSGAGNLQLGTSIFSVNLSGGNAAFDGLISGSGNLNQNGTGTWSLNGSNTFAGSCTINGTTFVNGTLPASLISVFGTLGGTGTVGRVSLGGGGTISPGLSPGRLTTSNLQFIVTSKYRVELNGTNAGTDYDQLKVNGAVNNLANATLSATLGFPSAISNSFTIIDNDGTDAVTNTFLGLPEGATVDISGTPFRISYVGGTGNDVELTQLTAMQQPRLSIAPVAPASVTLSWATNDPLFSLQSNTNLSTTNWSAVSPPPGIIGTNNVVTNAASGAQNFYRLFKP